MLYRTAIVAASMLLAQGANGFALAGAPDSVASRTRSQPVAMLAKKSPSKKMLKIILDADVDGLGDKGSLVEVKPAYAENFIIKNGLGSVATKEDEQRLVEAEQAAAEQAAKAVKAAAAAKEAVAAKFGKGLVIERMMGPDGKFRDDDVDAAAVASALERGGVKVAAEDVEMEVIEGVGSDVATLRLADGVTTTVKVVVKKSNIVLV